MSGLRAWYRRLDRADRASLTNITYGSAGTVLCVYWAVTLGPLWLLVFAGFFLLAVIGTAVNDLVLLVQYREYRKAVRADLDELERLRGGQ